MTKISKKEIRKTLESDKQIDYEKLRIDVLKTLVDSRNIECKQTKDSMIKHLKMDDEGKYVRPIEYEKQSDGKYIVKVDLKDSDTCREMGKLIEKGQAQRMNVYSNDRIYYLCNQKPL
jgi:hypothetical protein